MSACVFGTYIKFLRWCFGSRSTWESDYYGWLIDLYRYFFVGRPPVSYISYLRLKTHVE